MTIKEFFSFQKNKRFWVNIIAMIIAVVLTVFAVLEGLDIYTQHSKSVLVPHVKGMRESEAGILLRNHGFEYQVTDSNYVKGVSPGAILEQNPEGGMKVKSGRMIYLTINSLTTPLRQVPDVADNSSLRQAQAKLTASGFKLAPEEYVPGEKEWVYGVKYNGRELNPRDKVPAGATLTILVGNGEKDLSESDSLDIGNGTYINSEQPEASEQHSTESDSWF